mmetsp:Transcript_12846/g.32985  ORF Transcript_12846/g.32985 Transcript_12846/m.32985 type:complete len:274 (-) Transcript_12846:281-1102(-)|eukprot:jgi/Tetstr1/420551/TSEL_011641.t1
MAAPAFARPLLAALLLVLVCGTSQARRLSQEVRNDQSLDAAFKNVFARGEQNNVDQAVDISVPDVTAAPAQAVDDIIAADFEPLVLDPDNPTCTLADREVYQTFSITDDRPIGREASRGKQYEFYVRPGLEVRPIVLVMLKPGERSGGASIVTDGLEGETDVTRDRNVKTLCGNWAWQATGRYKASVQTDDTDVVLRYFVRKRAQRIGAFNADSALDIGLDVETTVAGSNKDLDTNTDVVSRSQNGKLVISLTNSVGDSNTPVDPFASFNWGI